MNRLLTIITECTEYSDDLHLHPQMDSSTMKPMAELAVQILLLGICIIVVADLALRFPGPSRFTGFLLPPQERWPVPQLWKWVEDGKPSPGFIKFFMRDPERSIPDGTGLISPVDGTVLAKLRQSGRNYLVISLSVWDVHVARCPCSAVVERIVEHGDMLEPERNDPLRNEAFYFLRDKASPKQRFLELSTDNGLMRVRFITSYLSRRIEFFVDVGEQLEKGQRIGRMLFGSTCVVETDEEFEFAVAVGERLVAGESEIGKGS